MNRGTIFSNIVVPVELENNDFLVHEILEVGKVISNFFDIFGTSTKIVKNDVDGNIKKVTNHAILVQPATTLTDVTVRQLVRYEQARKTNKMDPSGTVGLLWLKRTFDFTMALLQQLLSQENGETDKISMTFYLKRAYERTLSTHHNWIMKKTFNGIVSITAPYKTDFLRKLSLDPSMTQQEILDDVKISFTRIAPVLGKLHLIMIDLKEEKNIHYDMYNL